MGEGRAKSVDRTFAPRTDEARAEVTIDSRAYVLIEREMLAELQREIEAVVGRGVEGILMRAGYTRGARLAVRLSSLVGGNKKAFVEGLQVFAARTGLCRIEEVRIQTGRITIRATNSFVGISYGRSSRPVCHYLRGFALAVAETMVHRQGLECRELACIATKGDACVFEIVPVPGSIEHWVEDEEPEGQVMEWKRNA